MIENAIKTVLYADSDVGAVAGDRIYEGYMPQQPTFPNVVFTRSSTLYLMSLDGRNPKSNGTFQIDCRATTSSVVHDLTDKVLAALEAATTMTAIVRDRSKFPYEPGSKVHRVVLIVSIWQ